jgi:hemerythrin-like domain-containing protein
MSITDEQPVFDGRVMLMVHNMFRREFALMPALVRSVAAGDRERAQIISDHITNVNDILHYYHHSGDENSWPLLLNRCGEEIAPLVQLMESQQEVVARFGHEVDEALEAWRDSASIESRKALADALDRLLPSLREHFSAEEKIIIPLMEQHITAAEWARMVQEYAADSDPESLLLAFGMFMYGGDPEAVETAIASMPAEVRPVIRQLAAQAFGSYSERVHGTATPPRSTEL